MDRYTKRDGRTGRAYVDEKGAWLTPDGTIQGCAIEDLAEYEDIELTPEDCANYKKFEDEAISKNVTFNRIVELMEAEAKGRLIVLPCKVGDTVYRICPKCNELHNESCEHCAWRGTGGWHGCDVFGLWSDGQYPPDKCTIVPYKTHWNFMPTVSKYFGKTVFTSREAAEAALKEAQG